MKRFFTTLAVVGVFFAGCAGDMITSEIPYTRTVTADVVNDGDGVTELYCSDGNVYLINDDGYVNGEHVKVTIETRGTRDVTDDKVKKVRVLK